MKLRHVIWYMTLLFIGLKIAGLIPDWNWWQVWSLMLGRFVLVGWATCCKNRLDEFSAAMDAEAKKVSRP